MAGIHPIHQELDDLWNAAVSTPKSRHLLRDMRARIRLETEARGAEALQPWLAVLELGVDLLTDIHLAINGNRAGPPLNSERQVYWALTGAAASFGSSLLTSCIAGYDTPAKAQLRTYTEALLLLVATLYDPKLAIEYHAANTDPKVMDFWHKQASPRRLHQRVIEIEKSLGFSSGEVENLTDWRRREYEILSQSSHLSIVAASLTCLSPNIDQPEILRFRVLGGVTASSRRTLGYAATATWHSLILASSKLFPGAREGQALLAFAAGDTIAESIQARWSALSAIVPKYLRES